MIPRYIVRPRSISTTPRNLKEALRARGFALHPRHHSRHRASWSKDFFLTYPPEEDLEDYVLLRNSLTRSLHSDESNGAQQTHRGQSRHLDLYRIPRTFTLSTKPSQREQLARNLFPTPPTAITNNQSLEMAGMARDLEYPSRRYIVRPLRHSRGEGWRITEDPTDFTEGQEYIQAVYPKNHEYRVIAIRGEPLITLLKRVPEGFPRSIPWNHANGSTFITVSDPSYDRLRHTNVYEIIRSSTLLRTIDLAGIDIMYRRENEYVIAEVNLCPSLHIPANLEKVARYVHSLPER